MCVAFADLPATANFPAVDHAHRTHCPKCGEARWQTKPLQDGTRKPRKVSTDLFTVCTFHVLLCTFHVLLCTFWIMCQTVFFFPAKFWLRTLAGRADLAKHFTTPYHMHPPGSVQRSRGWQEKMVRDPVGSGVCVMVVCTYQLFFYYIVCVTVHRLWMTVRCLWDSPGLQTVCRTSRTCTAAGGPAHWRLCLFRLL